MAGIIDAHTHCYPQEVRCDPIAWAKSRGEAHWLKLVAPEGKRSLQGWVDRERMLADMDVAGVERAVLAGWYWENPATCEEQNRWQERWVAAAPERFIAFASVHPDAGANALEEVRRAHGEGARGIGEVHLGVQGVGMREANWLRIVEYAASHQLPILFHVSEALGRPHAARVLTPLEDFQWLAENYPELRLILAHWGGLAGYAEMNSHVRKSFRNVYYDTAAGPLLYDKRIWKSMVEVVGAGKILFGSDYPLQLYPKNQYEPNFSSYLDELDEADLEEHEREAIASGNICTLLGL